MADLEVGDYIKHDRKGTLYKVLEIYQKRCYINSSKVGPASIWTTYVKYTSSDDSVYVRRLDDIKDKFTRYNKKNIYWTLL